MEFPDWVRFRPARVEDSPRLAQVHLQTWKAAYRELLSARFLAELSTSVPRRIAVLEDAIAARKMNVWVAHTATEIVGWASFGSSRDVEAAATTGELRALNVVPRAWARGVGSGLWQAARRVLLDEGYACATVWVVEGNVRAVRFYEAAGFSLEPLSAMTVEEYGEPLPLVRYRVRLGRP